MVVNDRVVDTIRSPNIAAAGANFNPFKVFNFASSYSVFGEVQCGYVLALCHAVWQHASIGQLSIIPL